MTERETYRDRLGNLHKPLTLENMNNDLLSGDAIDGTTREEQAEFERNRTPAAHEYRDLVEPLPTRKHKI
ncbi:hypothetical protein CIG75_05635 [Tumebacillus algifaecis]|uniref:Uncharacterized protein n=1 Tax=Tumebacillus algifaecis TaxID=1214604 RepID=A0A223CYP8_9BACL|nr:hypothetical protein [Tumebacillus algifaecis]ASS74529.1 hypothetical protein CIG75_05635 [Tumebacillus algifaecis]